MQYITSGANLTVENVKDAEKEILSEGAAITKIEKTKFQEKESISVISEYPVSSNKSSKIIYHDLWFQNNAKTHTFFLSTGIQKGNEKEFNKIMEEILKSFELKI